ncbi:hypothetical protein FOCC_FOCC014961, partial [Frankliniella occidentalis]
HNHVCTRVGQQIHRHPLHQHQHEAARHRPVRPLAALRDRFGLQVLRLRRPLRLRRTLRRQLRLWIRTRLRLRLRLRRRLGPWRLGLRRLRRLRPRWRRQPHRAQDLRLFMRRPLRRRHPRPRPARSRQGLRLPRHLLLRQELGLLELPEPPPGQARRAPHRARSCPADSSAAEGSDSSSSSPTSRTPPTHRGDADAEGRPTDGLRLTDCD